MYGMGKAKLANELDLPVDEAGELISTFHTKVPFLKGTVNAVMKRIESPASGGSIRTLLGRKCRFPLYEPVQWGVNKALPYEQAIVEYGPRIKRAATYKGLNKLIQGSAADQTKAAMVALHKAGFHLMLQVHDEIALSVNTLEEAREAAHIMATAVAPGSSRPGWTWRWVQAGVRPNKYSIRLFKFTKVKGMIEGKLLAVASVSLLYRLG
jgi:DNA polymerase I-like protein with 3'-5' exonuclease and polymerase domains